MTLTTRWKSRNWPQSIEIPVRDSNEVVEVFLDELPGDPTEIQAILHQESAPIELYLTFAIEYFYQEKYAEFRYLLREGLAEASRRRGPQGGSKVEVPLLTALAAYNIALGLRIARKDDGGLVSEEGEKERLFEEATVLLNDAERYDQTDVRVMLRKGLLLLAQQKVSQAEYLLKSLSARFPNNIAARLAMGVMAFLSGDWKTALLEFQVSLKSLPSCPESVRVAIAQCFLRTGREQAAEDAFERVLSMSPTNVDALLGLAITSLNRGPKSLGKAMQLLKQAYDLDRSNPTVLYHLANHFFFKKDYQKAITLAQSAIQNAAGKGREDCRAEALYMTGKIQHAQQLYAEAFDSFSEAVKLNPDHSLAQLGLGQLCIQRGDASFAAECFSRVVELEERKKSRPIGDAEFWCMMGMVNLSLLLSTPEEGEREKGKVEAAKGMLEKASRLGDKSFQLFMSLAMLYETRDPIAALEAYERAKTVDAGWFANDPETLNNYGVILHLNGRLAEAKSVFEQAGAQCPVGSELKYLSDFNGARLCEDLGKIQEAESIYRELLKINPNDACLHLRLGLICAHRGQHGEAADHYKEAIGVQEGEVDGWVLLACSHLRVKALTPARKAFERILKQNHRHDAFSLVALGTIYVEIGRHERKSTAFKDNMRRALEFFIKALQLEPGNYVAANGVGTVLAEMGRWKEAKDVFLQVKQSAPTSFTDASLNLAHCFVELGQFVAAQHAYESDLGMAHGKRKASIMLFLARSFYAQAKAERQPAVFDRAIRLLEDAAALLPEDLPIRFNIGLCQQEVAAVTVKKAGSSEGKGGGGRVGGLFTDEEGSKAMSLLQSAAETFKALLDPAQTAGSKGIDLKIVEQRAKYCQSLKQSLSSRLNSLRSSESARQAKLEAVRQQREEQLAVEAAKRAQEEASRREEEARHEAIRQELAAKMRTTEERIQAAADDSDEGSASNPSDDGGPGRRRGRRPTGGATSRRGKRRQPVGEARTGAIDGDEGEEEEEEEEEAIISKRRTLSRGRMQLSKDFISDSDIAADDDGDLTGARRDDEQMDVDEDKQP